MKIKQRIYELRAKLIYTRFPVTHLDHPFQSLVHSPRLWLIQINQIFDSATLKSLQSQKRELLPSAKG